MAGIKTILNIFGIIVIGISVIIGIITGVLYYAKTGDNKPLIQSTVGLVFATDYNIKHDVIELQNKDITKDYSDYLKEKILMELFIIGLMVYLGYLLAYKIMNSANVMDWGWLQKLFIILIVITILGAIESLYSFLVFGNTVIPYSGVFSIFYPTNNFYNIIENLGIYSTPTTINNTIMNMT